jgi:hypothetical protein
MGLVALNATKTALDDVGIRDHPGSARRRAYRKLTGLGPQYMEDTIEMGACGECGKETQLRSLARHYRDQHQESRRRFLAGPDSGCDAYEHGRIQCR